MWLFTNNELDVTYWYLWRFSKYSYCLKKLPIILIATKIRSLIEYQLLQFIFIDYSIYHNLNSAYRDALFSLCSYYIYMTSLIRNFVLLLYLYMFSNYYKLTQILCLNLNSFYQIKYYLPILPSIVLDIKSRHGCVKILCAICAVNASIPMVI